MVPLHIIKNFTNYMDQSQAIQIYQPMLHSIAYNFLRCKEEAKDMVQETFLKWLSIDQTKVENTKAYLITILTNLCINHLNALKRKKEEYWDNFQLGEKITKLWETTDLSQIDMEAEISAALKVLHCKLEPMERAVYLLKEVFNFDYDTLQEVLDKKAENCRQMLCRAKKKLQSEKPSLNAELPKTVSLMDSFRKASVFGNANELIADLRKDISEALEKKF
jgi:RNA polymerase sigma factor (sigma-70 family)